MWQKFVRLIMLFAIQSYSLTTCVEGVMYCNKMIRHYFLGMFTKLQKETIDFIMSVCPSVHMEQLNSHSMDFHI